MAGDHTFHERILSDEWSVIDPAGRVLTKAEVLKEAFTGERSITEGMIDQIQVRDLGDWAVVTGRTRMSGSYQGEEMKVTLRFYRCLYPHVRRMAMRRLAGNDADGIDAFSV